MSLVEHTYSESLGYVIEFVIGIIIPADERFEENFRIHIFRHVKSFQLRNDV